MYARKKVKALWISKPERNPVWVVNTLWKCKQCDITSSGVNYSLKQLLLYSCTADNSYIRHVLYWEILTNFADLFIRQIETFFFKNKCELTCRQWRLRARYKFHWKKQYLLDGTIYKFWLNSSVIFKIQDLLHIMLV